MRHQDDITLADMSAVDAAVIDDRVMPILRRCLRDHSPATLIEDIARCAYFQGLSDGIAIGRDHQPALTAAIAAREGESHVEKA